MKTIKNYNQATDEYSLIEMCGRMVQVKKRQEGELALTRASATSNVDVLGTTCADCGAPAPYVIKEVKTGFTWCDCGVCCIGG